MIRIGYLENNPVQNCCIARREFHKVPKETLIEEKQRNRSHKKIFDLVLVSPALGRQFP